MRKDKEESESPDSRTASTSLRLLTEDIDQSYAASPPQISAAAPLSDQTEEKYDESDDDDFEFAFVVRDPDTGSSISADEIFSNGQIRPIYPIFNRELLPDGEETLRQPLRRLMMEERATEISPPAISSDELEGISPKTYCVWKPRSPEHCRKSVSTGSSLRWRIRDLVIRRSHSDGKEKFVFLETDEKKKEKGKAKKATDVDIVTANRRYYDRIGQRAAAKAGGAGRKSFLPYKPVGFFASVNGISRVHHPF